MSSARYTEKQRLVESVRHLSETLGRPVCSKDLRFFWNEHPNFQPILTQAIGQQLIKAARTAPEAWGRICPVGIIGNCTYYAPFESKSWMVGFHLHGLRLGLITESRKQMPVLARNLFWTEYEAVSRNALAGWFAEWGRPYLDSQILQKELGGRLDSLVEIAQREMSPTFVLNPPTDLVSRSEALRILKEEYSGRTGTDAPERFSPNKHLVRLKHPRSQTVGWEGYSLGEIRLYCQARWPFPDDDPYLAASLFAVSTYGRIY